MDIVGVAVMTELVGGPGLDVDAGVAANSEFGDVAGLGEVTGVVAIAAD